MVPLQLLAAGVARVVGTCSPLARVLRAHTHRPHTAPLAPLGRSPARRCLSTLLSLRSLKAPESHRTLGFASHGLDRNTSGLEPLSPHTLTDSNLSPRHPLSDFSQLRTGWLLLSPARFSSSSSLFTPRAPPPFRACSSSLRQSGADTLPSLVTVTGYSTPGEKLRGYCCVGTHTTRNLPSHLAFLADA